MSDDEVDDLRDCRERGLTFEAACAELDLRDAAVRAAHDIWQDWDDEERVA